MADVLVDSFLGIVPKNGARLLQNNQAQLAQNGRLSSGYLDALNEKSLVNTPGIAQEIQSIFRMSNSGVDYWIAWANDVDVAKSIVSNDSTQRIYYTGDGEPRTTNFSLATSATPYPAAWYVLGVYPPANAPTLSGAGGVSATNVSRSAAYTFVTPWGEESQPSPASATVTTKSDDTLTISGMDVAPANTFAITGASWSGGIATVNMASTFGMRVGEYVSVSGMTPSGFNTSSAKLTAVASGNVSFALSSNPGAFVAGGTMTRLAPHNTSGMTKRIYITITTASGTNFYFAKEIAVATASTTVAGTFTPGETILTTDWEMPPTDIVGIGTHPNGFNYAFRNNEMCFTEPGYPYAWPSKYRKGLPFAIIGTGTFGNSIVVGTKGNPYMMTGSDPATITRDKIDQPWPCMSKRSIASMPFGVTYAAPQGLVLIGSNGPDLATDDLYKQEDWKQLSPNSFYSAHYGGRYVASYISGATRSLLFIDRADAVQAKTVGINCSVVYGDQETGKLYLVFNNSIYEFDAEAGVKLNYDWQSKEFVFPAPINLAAAKVDASFAMSASDIISAQAAYNTIKTANAALISAKKSRGSVNSFCVNSRAVNGSLVKTPPPKTWNALTFLLYANGSLMFSRTVASAKAFRLPQGFRYDNCSFRLQGNVQVKRVILSQSMDSLRQV
jgi:hypothetical protein